MSNVREFPCDQCGKPVYFSLPATDLTRRCSHCGEIVSIPESLLPGRREKLGGSLSDGAGHQLDEYDLYRLLRESMPLLLAGVLFYLLQFRLEINLTDRTLVLQTRAIGDLLFLMAFMKQKQVGRFGFLPAAGIALCVLHLISRLAALVGLGDTVSLEFEILVNLVALLILYKVTFLVEQAARYRKVIWYAAVFSGLVVVLLIAVLLSVGVVAAVHNYLAQIPPLKIISLIFGALIPVFLLWLVASILTIYSVVRIKAAIEMREGVIA